MKYNISLLIVFILTNFAIYAKEESPKAPKVGDIAPEFTLQDFEEKEHSLKKLQGNVVFLIMGNRKIRKEDDKWAEAFRKDFEENEKVTAYIIADMRSVPGFIPKRFIRSQIKKRPPPVKFLFDWKGDTHKKYHTEKKRPNLYLISQEGKIVYHKKENFKPELYTELKKQVETLLKTSP